MASGVDASASGAGTGKASRAAIAGVLCAGVMARRGNRCQPALKATRVSACGTSTLRTSRIVDLLTWGAGAAVAARGVKVLMG